MSVAKAEPINPLGWLRDQFAPAPGTLFSPAADIFMAGGGALLFFIYFHFFVANTASVFSWSWAVYYAAFFVNYPHFASSYQMIYGDARPSYFDTDKNRKFALKLWWVGVVVPMILLGYFAYALGADSANAMGLLASAMFFFVGWHYVKQIFGCFIVLSSARRIYYDRRERWSVLAALYSLWFVSFVAANLGGGTNAYYQISYHSLALAPWILTCLYIVLALTSANMVAVLIRKRLRDGQLPPASALCALIAIYVWYIPTLSHPVYYYIIPFFHSLQYLLFVVAYRRNRSLADTSERVDAAVRPTFRRLTMVGSLLFLVLPFVVLGVTALTGLASSIDGSVTAWYGSLYQVPPQTWLLTTLVVLAAALLLRWSRIHARRSALGSFLDFFLGSFILGLILFALAPAFLDVLAANKFLPGYFSYDNVKFGTSLYLFFFTIFVNIHHYFIDNVIWKSNNPHVRSYLFAPKFEK